MRKILLLVSILLTTLLFSSPSKAQNLTIVTSTVIDPAGTVYILGRYTITLVNNSSQQAQFGGSNQFQQNYSGALDVNGNLSITLPSNAIITPPGTQWAFTICANPAQQAAVFPRPALPCFTSNQTISGASQVITFTAATITLPASAPASTLAWSGLTGFPAGCTNQVITALLTVPTCTTLTSSFLPAALIYNNQTNVYGAFLQDFTSGTVEIPEAAGFTTNVNSTIGLDLTANITHLWTNNADSLAAATTTTSTTTTQPLFATAVAGVYGARAIATGDLPLAIPIANVGTSGLTGTAPATISAAGAIGCATCVTSASSLANGGVVLGTAGTQASATNTQLTFVAPTLTVGLAGTSSGILSLTGSTSGNATLTAPAIAGVATNAVTSSNNLSAPALASTVATGTAPLSITSTTAVANLTVQNLSAVSGGLLPSAAGGTDVGSTALPFGNIWLGTAATNNFRFQPAATAAARVITILDPGVTSTLGLLGGTIALGNNTATWNWAQTTDAQDAITFGETSAATGGTLSNLLANQAELNLSTASGSTATPLEVQQAGVTGATGPPLAQFESTWNNASLVGQGIVENITNTNSAASSLLENLRVGNVTQWSVDKGGLATGAILQATIGTQIVSGADYTNSTTTPSTLFSWTLPATTAAKTYRYTCDIMWESTAATLTGPQFGVNISAAPTQLTSANSVQNTLAGADVNGYISNTTTGHQNVGVGTAAGATATNYWAKIWGTIEGAPVAGSTFIIDAAALSNTTSTLNIRRGSGCTLN